MIRSCDTACSQSMQIGIENVYRDSDSRYRASCRWSRCWMELRFFDHLGHINLMLCFSGSLWWQIRSVGRAKTRFPVVNYIYLSIKNHDDVILPQIFTKPHYSKQYNIQCVNVTCTSLPTLSRFSCILEHRNDTWWTHFSSLLQNLYCMNCLKNFVPFL